RIQRSEPEDEKLHFLSCVLVTGCHDPSLNKKTRREIIRVGSTFVMKGKYNRLFYIGPCKQCMRLVVMSEKEKFRVLEECHHNPGTGNHNSIRGTKNRVISGYFWPTLAKDVADWLKCCHQCQMNDPIKTVAPVLHSIKVKEAWEVLGLDLIGPLTETSRGNRYVLTMTDLYTKWVIAEPLQSKTAHKVSLAVTTKLYMFGMVRKIITDQGKEFKDVSVNVRSCKALNNIYMIFYSFSAQTALKLMNRVLATREIVGLHRNRNSVKIIICVYIMSVCVCVRVYGRMDDLHKIQHETHCIFKMTFSSIK
uniref:Integrase catalytic domain-containing protein n=1 Tax=Paramormyrops kingsleyae TaxID=1676925 RepID=A0A3B3QB65_9TELE